MKKKFFVVGVFLIACITLFVWYNCANNNNLNGVITINGKTEKGYATLQYKNGDSLFGFAKIHGNINVCLDESEEKSYAKYEFSKDVLKADDVYMVTVNRYSEKENRVEFGEFYFDKEMKNVILITEEMEFISANDSFSKKVERLNGK